MRPVKPNPNPAYKIPANMSTKKKAVIEGLKYNLVDPNKGTKGTFTTTKVLQVLFELTEQNDGKVNWGNLKGKDKALVPALISYFSKNDAMKYGNARGSLIDNYGQYCSYCGTMVQDTALAIEHCLPKAVFPSEMLYYKNFFLCCPSCNSNKGSKPTYAEGLAWAKKTYPKPTTQQVLQGGMDRQLWPDAGQAWTGFPFRMVDTLAKVPPIDMKYALDLNNVFVGITDNIVSAKIVGYKGGATVTVAAQEITDNFKSPTLQEQEDNFIKIVKINDFDKGNYSDRRTTNRTVTWLNTLLSVNLLNMFTPGSAGWTLQLQQMFITIRNAGFYEQWLWLFWYLSPPSVGANSLYTRFKAASTDPAQPNFYFPGTDASKLP